jgi:uncharacterized membrane protein YuzA (DUF378 family)
LDPKILPLLFVVGAVLLGVVSNATYELIKAWISGDDKTVTVVPYVFVVGAGLLLLLLLSVSVFNALRQRFGQKLQIDEVKPRQGLVVLVSQGQIEKIPALAAIQFHQSRLAHCWLIAPPRPAQENVAQAAISGQSSGKNAEDLMAMFAKATFKMHLVNRLEDKEVDADDPASVVAAIESVYRQASALKLPNKEMIADITGGTKPMTAAMALACTKANRDMEYLLPRKKDEGGRADPSMGSVPKLLNLRLQLN